MAVIELIAGRISPFVALILVFAVILYYIFRASSIEDLPELRRIAGIDAIDDAVNRCAELGKPIHFTLGIGSLSGTDGAQTIAAIGVMSHVTKLAAQLDMESIVTLCQLQLVPIVEGIVRDNYESEGKIFKQSYVRYVGAGQSALSIAVQGIMDREKPGANFMMGSFDEEGISIAEKGYRIGAFGIGATTTTGQMGILAATMDYFLLGEELYAVGAYMTKDPIQTMSIAAIDIWKIVALATITVGFMLINLGIPIVRTILRA